MCAVFVDVLLAISTTGHSQMESECGKQGGIIIVYLKSTRTDSIVKVSIFSATLCQTTISFHTV